MAKFIECELIRFDLDLGQSGVGTEYNGVTVKNISELMRLIYDNKGNSTYSLPTEDSLNSFNNIAKVGAKFKGKAKTVDTTETQGTILTTTPGVSTFDYPDYRYNTEMGKMMMDNNLLLTYPTSPDGKWDYLFMLKMGDYYMYIATAVTSVATFYTSCDGFIFFSYLTKATVINNTYSVGLSTPYQSATPFRTPTNQIYCCPFICDTPSGYLPREGPSCGVVVFVKNKSNSNKDYFYGSIFGIGNDSDLTPYLSEPNNSPTETNTSEAGGFGTYTRYDDNIITPDLPIDCDGLGNNLYVLDKSLVNSLVEFLWSTDFVDNLTKYFANPSETILSLSVVKSPYTVKGSGTIMLGNINSPISASYISNWQIVDCGTIHITPYYDNYLDCNPFTRYTLYLPFYSYIDIDECFVRDCDLNIKYYIDYYSMSALIFITSIKNGISRIVNMLQCNIAMNVPISMVQKNQIINMVSSTLSSVTTANPVSIASGVVGGTIKSAFERDTISNIGVLSNASALLSYPYPYIIIKRAVEQSPPNLASYQGLPNWNTNNLSAYKGFTRVYECIDSINFINETQQKELISILKSGFII